MLSKFMNGNQQVVSRARIDSRKCSAEKYESVACGLLKTMHSGNARIVWSVIQESFSYGSFGKDASHALLKIPDSLEACWNNLPARLLPQSVYAGLDALKRFLLQIDQSTKQGTGFYMVLDLRGYFIGFSEQDTIFRISRDATYCEGDRTGLSQEWLQQTAMLYRNRTGRELSVIRVLFDHSVKVIQPDHPQMQVQAVAPDSGHCNQDRDFPVLISCIGSVITGDCNLQPLQIRMLQDRQTRTQMKSAFQLGSMLLLSGWIALLVGACRNPSRDEYDSGMLHEWEDAKKVWQTGMGRMLRMSEQLKEKRIEITLVGLIGKSLPQEIHVNRIRIENGRDDSDGFLISLKGEVDSDGGSVLLQDWLDKLMRSGVIERVRDLRFERFDETLGFHLEGESPANKIPS